MKLKIIIAALFITLFGVFGADKASAQVRVEIGPQRHHRHYHRRPPVIVRERPVVVRERVVVRRPVRVYHGRGHYRGRGYYGHHRHYRR